MSKLDDQEIDEMWGGHANASMTPLFTVSEAVTAQGTGKLSIQYNYDAINRMAARAAKAIESKSRDYYGNHLSVDDMAAIIAKHFVEMLEASGTGTVTQV